MNKIEEVLLKFYPDIKDCELDEPIRTCASELNDLLLEFGKQCFEAGRDSKKIYNPEKDGKLEMITIIVEYKSFEDYLKSLENGD